MPPRERLIGAGVGWCTRQPVAWFSRCVRCVYKASLNFTLLVFPVKEYSKTIHSGYSAVAYQPDKKRNGKFEDPRLEEMSGYRAGMRL